MWNMAHKNILTANGVLPPAQALQNDQKRALSVEEIRAELGKTRMRHE